MLLFHKYQFTHVGQSPSIPFLFSYPKVTVAIGRKFNITHHIQFPLQRGKKQPIFQRSCYYKYLTLMNSELKKFNTKYG